jgi:hypothetical protein
MPVGDPGADLGQLGVRRRQLLRASANVRREQQLPAGRSPQAVLDLLERPLVGHLEGAHLLDGVPPPLDPDGVLLGGREDVEDAAPHGELASLLNQFHSGIGDVDESADDRVEPAVDILAGGQGDRLEVAQPGHLRLQQAADGSHNDVERAGRRVVRARVGQPAEHREAPSDGVRPGRQALVRQGLPAGVEGDTILGQEAGQGGHQVFGLPAGGRHGQHRAARRTRPASTNGRSPDGPVRSSAGAVGVCRARASDGSAETTSSRSLSDTG